MRKKIGAIGRRVVSVILCLALVSTGLVAFAGDNNRATVAENVDAQHLYVYDLVQLMLAKDYSMSKNVLTDDYFDVLTANSFLSVFGNNALLAALRGDDAYMEEHMNTAVLDAVELDVVADAAIAQVRNDAQLVSDIYSYTDAFEWDLGVADEVCFALEALSLTLEATETINKMTNAYEGYLYALNLVAKNSDDKIVVAAAKDIYKSCTAKDAKDAFVNCVKEFGNTAAESFLTDLAFCIGDAVDLTVKLVTGDDVDNRLKQHYSMQLQNEISDTFFDILYAGGSNYLIRSYEENEIADLTALAALYLKTGYEGMEAFYPKNAKACSNALADLQTKEIPRSSGVTIASYSVPGQYVALSEGDKFVCFGKINSEKPLESVTVKVVGNGKTYIEVTENNIGKTSFNILMLDNRISMGTLAAGSYTYQVSCRTADGGNVLLNERFDVKKEADGCLIFSYRLPQSVKEGGAFSVRGTVSADTMIRAATVEILNLDGKRMTGGTQSVDANAFDLSKLDSRVVFGILDNSNADYTVYRYRVRVELSNGKNVVLVDQPFMVQ